MPEQKMAEQKQKKNSSLRTALWILIFIGFLIMEFPGILFINRIEPMLFGMPFIYSFTIIMWVYMCILMLIGYKKNWGSPNTDDESAEGGE